MSALVSAALHAPSQASAAADREPFHGEGAGVDADAEAVAVLRANRWIVEPCVAALSSRISIRLPVVWVR